MTTYTLLIVESPTLARIIDHFRLPGVEAIATGGFSWQPQWDEKNQQLKPKANPELRSFRNKLKEKAPWASQIIIATDPDPAGSFISYSISRFLKSPSTRRAYIHSLSPTGIQQAIDESFSMETEESKLETFGVLRNRYLILKSLYRNLMSKIGSNPWAKLVLYRLFDEPFPFAKLGNQSHSLLLSGPINCRHDTTLTIDKVTDDQQLHKSTSPLNTAALLELLSTGPNKMAQNQDALNRLFTTIPDEINTGLISYPRTAATGYYRKTWELSYQYWMKDHEAETFLPGVLWDILCERTPHESLKPIDPSIDPSAVRPLVRKNLYDIYRLIYNHFIKSICTQSIQTEKKVIISNGKEHYKTGIIGNLQGQRTFGTMISVSDMLNTINAFGASRPSGFGKLYDDLINEKWISGSGIFLTPGAAFYDHQFSRLFTWRAWLEDLISLMNDSTIEVSKLKSTLDRMIKELPF